MTGLLPTLGLVAGLAIALALAGARPPASSGRLHTLLPAPSPRRARGPRSRADRRGDHVRSAAAPAVPRLAPPLSAHLLRAAPLVAGGLALVALAVAPPLAGLPLVATWAARRTQARRRRRAAERAVAEQLPDAVDLLLLCTTAGWSLPLAHPRVAAHLVPPLGPALHGAELAVAGGMPRADALVAALAPLGDRARALGQVLADHLHYGVALAPGLERLGAELRLDRRRRAELDARQVPVRLLGPLVCCVLPAFALLTVVPLLGASLRALPR